MRDVLDRLLTWWEAGESVAVGTVVATFESAPRPPGAVMLVGPGLEAVGSVSGGCVEGAVYQLGEEVLESGEPVLQRYGVSDESAFAVGLTCGGILDIFVEKVDRTSFPELAEVAADIAEGRPVAVATVVAHPDPSRLGRRLIVRPEQGTEVADTGARPADRVGASSSSSRPERSEGRGGLGSERADDAVLDDARGLLANGRTETLEYGPDGERRGRGCGCSCRRTRRCRGCWCSGRSTSRLRSHDSVRSSATA